MDFGLGDKATDPRDDFVSTCEGREEVLAENKTLRRLVGLHREREAHRERCQDLQRRIARDEEDISRLVMLANQYKKAAEERAGMATANRVLRVKEQRLCEEKTKLIQDLQRDYDAPGDGSEDIDRTGS